MLALSLSTVSSYYSGTRSSYTSFELSGCPILGISITYQFSLCQWSRTVPASARGYPLSPPFFQVTQADRAGVNKWGPKWTAAMAEEVKTLTAQIKKVDQGTKKLGKNKAWKSSSVTLSPRR